MRQIKCYSFVVGFLIVGIPPLMAQKSPKESAMITMGVHEEITASQPYGIEIFATVQGETNPLDIPPWTNEINNSTPVSSPNVTFLIYPGRMYLLQTGSNSWNWADVHFNVPPGYTLYLGSLNVPMQARTSFLALSTYGTWQESFYVLPGDGAAWLNPGYSAGPRIDDIRWSMSAGQLASGVFAGSLNWRGASMSAALLSGKALTFASGASIVNLNTPSIWNSFFTTQQGYIYPSSIPDQVAIYYAADGSPKFICTNQIEIYISEQTGGGFYIYTYPAGTGIGLTNNDPTQPWGFVNPWNSYFGIGSATNPFTDSIEIQRTDRATGLVETWIITQYLQNNLPQTTLSETDNLRTITTTSTATSGGRSETVTVTDANNDPPQIATKNYQTFPWGEELVSEVEDPGGLALTTTYTYYNTTVGDGHFSKLKSVTRPDGSWILYDYYDDFGRWGELASVSTPWQDAPTTCGAATASNCKVTTYNYVAQVYNGYQYPSGTLTSTFQTLNAGNLTKINGTVTAQTTVTPSVFLSGTYTSYLFNYEPMRTDTIQSFSASGSYQTTIQTVFHNTADPVYDGKLYSQVNTDGTKIAASYWKGSFSSQLGNSGWASSYFYVNSSSGTWVSNYLTGTATQPYIPGTTQLDPTAVQFATDGITGGMAIDPVWIVPYKSFRRQTVTDIFGNPAYDVTEVFVGGSTGFQIISWKYTGYRPMVSSRPVKTTLGRSHRINTMTARSRRK